MLNFIQREFIVKGVYYKFIFVILIIVTTIIINKIFKRFSKRSYRRFSKIIALDITSYRIFVRITSVFIYLIGFSLSVYIIPELKALAISLFAGAGVLAVIIGFAAQSAFSNLISGIFIAVFKPFRVGDIIKFNDRIGTVEDITLRHTIINSFENKRFVVPNTKISEEVIENFHLNEEKTCCFIEMSISYNSNIDKAIEIMSNEILQHPLFHDIRTNKEKEEQVEPLKIKVIELAEYSIKIRAWAWVKSPMDSYNMSWDLNKIIKQQFDKNEIEIPFPYSNIIIHKPS